MAAYGVGGIPGGKIDTLPQNVRPQVAEGQAVRAPASLKIPTGSVVEGLVTAQNDEGYQVRIGGQTLQARATIPLFVGQRFRAVWDASQTPPTLRLQQSDLAVVAKFTGKDQQIALALLGRGLPVKEEIIWGLRQQWMQLGGDPSKLGAAAELWARGAPINSQNVELLSWYMQLSPNEAAEIWKKIRDRLRDKKAATPEEMLKNLKNSEDPDILRFLKAHSLVGKPMRQGLDPSMLLAPAWWPVGEEEGKLMMARVAVSNDSHKDRSAWWVVFDVEGQHLGHVNGDVMTNGQALSINLRLETALAAGIIQLNLNELRKDLEEVSLATQHIGVGVIRRKWGGTGQGVDMEA